MADANHKVAIIVAVIGVTGTLGTALLANWDKVFGRTAQAGPQVTATPPVQTPAPGATTTSATTTSATTSSTTPPTTPTARSGAVPTLTGNWRDSTGPNNISRVRQVGNSFQYSRQGILPNGTAFEASGSGTLEGQQVSTRYQARYGNSAVSSGTCSGAVSADATRMDLQCVDSLLGGFSSIAIRE